MSAITITHLGKAYKRYPGKWARLTEWVTGKEHHEKHWVLRDINFDVSSGEAVGIIGVNGAGKSTLLKIITGTTQPTCGTVQVKGRVAALLELGMGFHPDFSGRQNVFMAGQLQGLSAQEIKSLFRDIESFADIGDYIDQPVRTYSSGMQVRLAFAVATAVRPDVLIVDEALAVGDAAFQRKCHRRIESFLEQGTSLLFVSHDIEGVKKLCQRALFISHGELMAYGSAKSVCDQYENMLFGATSTINTSNSSADTSQPGTRNPPKIEELIDPALIGMQEASYGNGQAIIENVWMEDKQGRNANVITSGEDFSVCYTARLSGNTNQPVVAMLIKTLEGVALYGTDSVSLEQPLITWSPNRQLLVRFNMKCHLAPGIYFLNCGIRDAKNPTIFFHRRVDVLMFKVYKNKDLGQVGLLNLDAKLSLTHL